MAFRSRKDIAYQEFVESPPPRLEIGKCEVLRECVGVRKKSRRAVKSEEKPKAQVRREQQCRRRSERERDTACVCEGKTRAEGQRALEKCVR